MLRTDVTLPSSKTISRDIKEFKDATDTNIKEFLQVRRSFLFFSLGSPSFYIVSLGCYRQNARWRRRMGYAKHNILPWGHTPPFSRGSYATTHSRFYNVCPFIFFISPLLISIRRIYLG